MSEISPGTTPQSKNSDQFWGTYWTSALDKWRDADRKISRSTTLMLGAAVLFELINRNLVNGINLDFTKISKPTFVLAIIPIVISYLYFSTASATASLDWTSHAYWKAFDKACTGIIPDPKAWYRNALVPSGGIYEAWLRMDHRATNVQGRLASFGGSFKAIIAILWPPIFEVYIFVELLRRFKDSKLLIWGIIVVSALLLTFSVFTFFSAPSTPGEEATP